MGKLAAAALIAATAAASACGRTRTEDGGPTVAQSYQVANFQEIEVAGPYNVTVRTGRGPTVSARGSQKLIEHMVVEVKDGKLLIHPVRRKGWFRNDLKLRGKVDLAVTVPQLRGARIAGSGDIAIDRVQGDSFDGAVAGSGGLDVGTLEVQKLKLAIAGSGDVRAAAGKAQTVSYDIAGSGDIDAKGIQAQTADVSIAGSGSVAAHATGTADVSIMGSGDVEVTGGAKCNVSKAGSGDVRCS